MRRIAVPVVAGLLAVALAAPGCGFAVKHPAITTGIVSGTLSLAMCGLNSSDTEQCLEISAAIGVGLGGIAATALLLGNAFTHDERATPAAPPPQVDWSQIPDTTPPPQPPPPPPVETTPAPVETPPPTPAPTP